MKVFYQVVVKGLFIHRMVSADSHRRWFQLGLGPSYNIYLMHQLYNDFYPQAQQGDSSDENYDFKAWSDEPQMMRPQSFNQTSKKFGLTLQTSNTLQIQTSRGNFEHLQVNQMENSVEFDNQVDLINDKRSELKKEKIYNIIETNFNCLERTVRSYKGDRLQTINLNKYYTTCMKDHVRALSACKIIQHQEMEIFNCETKAGKILTNCGINETAVMKRCERYSRSTEIMRKLLTSGKMCFQNKLMAIKYASVFSSKLKGSAKSPKSWKNSRS